MMGKPYPVIESPVDTDSILGKPCMQGYQSHYVVVKHKATNVFFPCRPDDTPDYDEVVVFSKNQILPRYLVYYKK